MYSRVNQFIQQSSVWKGLKKSSLEFAFIGYAIVLLIIATMAPYSYLEVDSYALPVISMQYRASMIVEPQDLNQAQIDFPSLYANINGFEDLRASKLNKIDENHWLPYYYPVYAVFCMPAKILLQTLHLDQTKTFALTNTLVFIFSLYFVLKKSKNKNKKWVVFLLALCPVYRYLIYIGAEVLMMSMVTIALICWQNKNYRSAALLVSIACMMNPTIMAIGIIMFLEYLYNVLIENKGHLFERKTLCYTLSLCACYIPSLIPFGTNWVLLGVLNPTMGYRSTGDTIIQRFMAYFGDLNFGFASFSLLGVVCLIISLIYAIRRKKTKLLFEHIALIFVVFCFSIHTHINCGMYNCARYIIWVYPLFVVIICDFVEMLSIKKSACISLIIGATNILLLCVNMEYPYIDFNNVSKYILNHCPAMYVTFCDSSFVSRTKHVDGGYDFDNFVIYVDSETGELRKVLYANNMESKEELIRVLESNTDSSMEVFRTMLKNHEDGKKYYINISPNDTNQYVVNDFGTHLYKVIENIHFNYYKKINEDACLDLVQKIKADSEDAYDEIVKMLNGDTLSNSDFVHALYTNILQRQEMDWENDIWTGMLDNGTPRQQAVREFLSGAEFAMKK